MGTKIEKKLIILSCILIATCVLVYSQNRSPQVVEKPLLRSYFSQIDGYNTERIIDFESDISTMLDLDDYLFADYQGPDGKINLYIGYYYTANKAYAAHSPLICYPSQGWKIDEQPTEGTLQVGPHTIHYEAIVTSLAEQKELVLYWYQARLQTATQVYKNKVSMGYNKFAHNDEQHSFIRVAFPFPDTASREQILQVGTDFIKVFYPKFVDFVVGE